MSKRFLCVGEQYEKNGEKKVSWKRIGEIFTSQAGKEYAKLYMHPGLLISVFAEEKKGEGQAPVKQSEWGPLAPDQEITF